MTEILYMVMAIYPETENLYMVMTDPENEKKQINDENLYMVMSR